MSEDILIRGGRGGTRATLEDLRDGARALVGAADLLDDAAASVAWAQGEGLAGVAASPATARAAELVVAPLLRGPMALDALADALRSLARCLHRAADAYEDAERAASTVLRTVLAAVGQTAGDHPLGTLAGSVLGAGWLLPRGAVLAGALGLAGVRPLRPRDVTVDVAEHAVQLAAGLAHGLAPGAAGGPTPVPAVRASGHLVVGTGIVGMAAPALRRRPLRVTARPAAAGVVPPPRDAADVLAGVRALHPGRGGAAGTVGVDRLDHPDGTRGWVVTIPGTQDARSWGTSANPMDMLTNVRLMAATTDDASALVARALDRSGARPGEPVLLAGHSQGGIVATALAGSARFTARHPVAAVLTAGSPVASHAVPAGTAALHLEHRQDLVPALDGWRNPDERQRTTAVRDLASSSAPADRSAARSPGAAHGLEAYARTAAAVQAAGGASVRGWEQAAAHVLGGPGTTAYHREFTGERLAPTERDGVAPTRPPGEAQTRPGDPASSLVPGPAGRAPGVGPPPAPAQGGP